MDPAFLNRVMARSHRRRPTPESWTIVRMSMSIKPLASVGVPKHIEARSRWDRIVSRTIWQASRRSERVCLCWWDCRGGHFSDESTMPLLSLMSATGCAADHLCLFILGRWGKGGVGEGCDRNGFRMAQPRCCPIATRKRAKEEGLCGIPSHNHPDLLEPPVRIELTAC